MKIIINTKKLRLLLTTGALTLGLTSCAPEAPDKTQKAGEIHYNVGEHKIIEVDKDFGLIFGKNGLYGLEAPSGYKVVDYDYDMFSFGMSYSDYYYENSMEVTTDDPNSFGLPVNAINDNDNDSIYEAGEHSIVSINRGNNITGSFDFKKDLEAPDGYKVVDYDYDSTGWLEFENISYQNTIPVKVIDFDDFGTPINSIIKDNKDYYDIGEHNIVMLSRIINPFFGKKETKTIEAPIGYEIIDYDYDKLTYSEYETILFRNIVPVSKVKNDFGKPLKDINEIDEALVVIDREFDLSFGKVRLEEAKKKDGYDLIDFDFDKNDGFEFNTYVYKKDN